MTQVHPLVTIEETATIQQTAPKELRSGTVNYGATLVEMYCDENGEATKVQQLQAMAKVITCEEFTKAVKHAATIADATDKSNGFLPADDATGSSKYGPKRSMLNARMSEARRIFGVAKQAPDVLKEKGYWPALKAAREWLDNNVKTWDGQHAQSSEEKAAAKAEATRTAAMIGVMNKNPKQKGEDRADYLKRIDGMMTASIDAAEAIAFAERVSIIEKSLRKQFKDEFDALLEACTRILATSGAEEAPM